MSPRSRRFGFRLFPAFLLAATVAALALGGCGDDDDGNPLKPQAPTYPDRSTPANVLSAYEIAYSARDTVKIADLYDSTYTGSSVDLSDPSYPIDFTLENELAHIRELATNPGIFVSLELGNTPVWNRLGSDDPSHPEWSVIQISGSSYRIEIIEGNTAYGAVGEAGTFQEFAFRPELDDTSPTDTLWRIVRWRETGRSGP